jgi:hypothetical protein
MQAAAFQRAITIDQSDFLDEGLRYGSRPLHTGVRLR